MARRVKLDQLTQEIMRMVHEEVNGEKLAKDFDKWIQQSSRKAKDVRQNRNSVRITFHGLSALAQANQSRFIDLKPYFARSSKAKQAHDKKGNVIPGSWYLRVPISLTSRDVKKVGPRSLYEELTHSDFGTTIDMDAMKMQSKLGTDQSMVLDSLQYQWASGNVTRVENESREGTGRYVSFRTVSDRTPPSAWIVGRQNARTDDPELSIRMQQDINRAMRYKMKLYISHMQNIYGKKW